MKTEIIPWIWLIGGVILMVLEFLMPGMIIVFFGAAAVIVGILNFAGIITSILNSFIAWFLISLALVLAFRKLALKLFPSESTYQLVEEDVDAIGKVVEVVKTVEENNSDGRISFSGTSWPAISNNGTIKVGEKARILYRDNISWVVEPCSEEKDE